MLAVSLGPLLLSSEPLCVDELRASSQYVSQASGVKLYHFCHISVIEAVTKSCPDLGKWQGLRGHVGLKVLLWPFLKTQSAYTEASILKYLFRT